MILFDTVIQVSTGPMSHCLPQHAADRSGIRAMAVGGYLVRANAHGDPWPSGRRPERPSCRGAHLAWRRSGFRPGRPPDKGNVLAPDLQLRLIAIPADARSAPNSAPALAQRPAAPDGAKETPPSNCALSAIMLVQLAGASGAAAVAGTAGEAGVAGAVLWACTWGTIAVARPEARSHGAALCSRNFLVTKGPFFRRISGFAPGQSAG